MAMIDCELRGDFFTVRSDIENTIKESSISASYEDGSNITMGEVYCSVRVYERYSYLGKNRVSMSVTLMGDRKGRLHLTAITSGGSQAMFFKLNTLGEKSFLDTLQPIIERYQVHY